MVVLWWQFFVHVFFSSVILFLSSVPTLNLWILQSMDTSVVFFSESGLFSEVLGMHVKTMATFFLAALSCQAALLILY